MEVGNVGDRRDHSFAFLSAGGRRALRCHLEQLMASSQTERDRHQKSKILTPSQKPLQSREKCYRLWPKSSFSQKFPPFPQPPSSLTSYYYTLALYYSSSTVNSPYMIRNKLFLIGKVCNNSHVLGNSKNWDCLFNLFAHFLHCQKSCCSQYHQQHKRVAALQSADCCWP